MIREMLQPNPSDRPTIEDIYQTIQSDWEQLLASCNDRTSPMMTDLHEAASK